MFSGEIPPIVMEERVLEIRGNYTIEVRGKANLGCEHG
jgi:hypothetical protein